MSNDSIRLECLSVLRICQIFYNLFSGMKKKTLAHHDIGNTISSLSQSKVKTKDTNQI